MLKQVPGKFAESLQAFADHFEGTVNPIGGTFLSRQNMKKLRTITEGCASFGSSGVGTGMSRLSG